jgi:hypothetical protein
MPIASAMAESKSVEEPGAPVAKDAIDPDLIKLKRARPKVGVITSAGIVFLCTVFLLRLNADRRFGGHDEAQKVTVQQILAGDVGADSYVTVAEAEPLMSHAIRTSVQKGGLGLRVAPVRGTGEMLWLVLPGNGWEQPSMAGYTGRLRPMSALPFASAVDDFATDHPRPMFATAAATRAGLGSGKVTAVSGEALALSDGDTVALDVVDPGTATIVAALNERLPSAQAWTTALTAAGITAGPPQPSPSGADQVRFEVKTAGAVASTTTKLEAAGLWAARVEPITRHYQTTWAGLKASSAAGFVVAQGVTIPDAELDLIGLYTAKQIPSGAYALIEGEKPADFWYVLPISIGLALIGLLFLWALIRAVKRDLLPTPTPG